MPYMSLTMDLRSGIIILPCYVIFVVGVYEKDLVETTINFSPVEADACD